MVEVTDVDDPLVGPDYVLINVAVAGVNPVDWKIVAGYLQGAFPHHLPLIPGWDVAGEVVALGPAVTEVALGDQVAAYARKDHVQNGTFAELVAVSVRSVAKLPDGVDIVDAGAVPLAGLTAAQLLSAEGRVASIVDADAVKEFGGRYVFVRPDGVMLGGLLRQVADGDLRVHLAERFPLERAGDALAASKAGHVRGKVVITV